MSNNASNTATPILAPASDYSVERARFLAAAESVGATIEHHRHPLAGPDGTALFTDVARLGQAPGQAKTVLVVNSGLHGVEGHAGSALQTLLLERGEFATLDPELSVLLVHAANPFGLAWDRRVDHENIDVNRNFVDYGAPLPANPGYDHVRIALNPTEPDFDLDDHAWMLEVFSYGEREGMDELYKAVSAGQYTYREGVQFGGTGPAWSRIVLEKIWARHLPEADVVVHFDIHTGLGPCGGLTTFQTADPDESAAQAAQDWFEGVYRADRSVSNQTDTDLLGLNTGVLGPGLDRSLGAPSAGPLVVPLVLEWGTVDEAAVVTAMRADNWVHSHGDPTNDLGRTIRQRTREAFFVEDPSWREAVAIDGISRVQMALANARLS